MPPAQQGGESQDSPPTFITEHLTLSTTKGPHRMSTLPIPIPSRPHELHLAQILTALTYALDLTEGHPQGHTLRSCIIGMRLGQRAGLTETQLSDLFYALLLKDVGSTSNAARMLEILGCEGVEANALVRDGWHSIGWKSIGRIVRRWHDSRAAFAASHGFRAMIRVPQRINEYRRSIIRTRSENSSCIARDLGLSWSVAEAIYHIDERWNGSGHPDGLARTHIPVLSQITKLAQTLDAAAESYGEDNAMAYIRRSCRGWFDTTLLPIAESLTSSDLFWRELHHHDLLSATLALEPEPLVLAADSFAVDRLCIAFARIIDARSHYTLTHSEGVATTAVTIAQRLGLNDHQIQTLRRAALLHDIGKLAVPISILDKPGKLTPDEWRIMREHPRYTDEILRRIPGFEEIATIAAAHHERLDGTGYHCGLSAPELSLSARILAVADIYDALSHTRSYRSMMSPAKVEEIILSETPHGLDPTCVNALFSNETATGIFRIRAA